MATLNASAIVWFTLTVCCLVAAVWTAVEIDEIVAHTRQQIKDSLEGRFGEGPESATNVTAGTFILPLKS